MVHSANLIRVSVISGNRRNPTPNYFIGKGKLAEIQTVIEQTQATLVIFNHNLSAAQERNLEKAFDCRVVDRTELILTIFSQRARSYEGKLQVELAQLDHLFTRLKRGWTHLDRLKGGVNLRGTGETQLEADRRLVRHRIKSIKNRLERVRKQRFQSRQSRSKANVPTIGLVGYTNAGKSTLFNQLTDSTSYAADQLFATLDPTIRKLEIPSMGELVLVDTVGFIRELPHSLIDAFQATLEETIHADLLLQVIDSTSTEKQLQQIEVEKVLTEIGADKIPRLQVYNKIDIHTNQISPQLDHNDFGEPKRVWLSAQKKQGFDLLFQAIAKLLNREIIEETITLTADQGDIRAKLHKNQAILAESFDEQGNMTLTIRLDKLQFAQLTKQTQKSS